MYKKYLILLSFVSSCALANQAPSNQLQVEYQRKISTTSTDYFGIQTISHIPRATYQYLNQVFDTFYRRVNLNTNISDSTFVTNSHYELIALPLFMQEEHGVGVEVFGNFYDPFTQNLSNLSSDQAMSNYFGHSEQVNLYESEFALGAGISYKADSLSQFKVVFSNENIPGYGGSTALFGYEKKF